MLKKQIGLLIIVAMILGISGANAQSEKGLVAEWHFDEGSGNVAKDSSENGNDGTIYGAIWVDGKFGKALSFDGMDDYVNIKTFPNLDALTYEAWVFIDPAFNTGERRIISKDNFYQPGIRKAIALKTSSPDISRKNGHAAFVVVIGEGNYDQIESPSSLTSGWHHLVGIRDTVAERFELYVDGVLVTSKKPTVFGSIDSAIPTVIGQVSPSFNKEFYNGKIDEVRIYNRALSAEEIKEHYESGPSALSLTKTPAPNSIKQGQTTTITLTVKNTGSTEISDIEIADIIPKDLTLMDGETKKTYTSLSSQDSRQFQYSVQINEAGTFNLGPATASYADNKGNYKTINSKPASIEVIPSLVTDSKQTSSIKSNGDAQSASVNLHGEKTDVELGENVLLKLSAINIIGNPIMHVQVIIIPPNGWSVTSSEFSKSGAGQYVTMYDLKPEDGSRDIEVKIMPNQIGDNFEVKGRIIYYFGEDLSTREDHTLSMPIKVRPESKDTENTVIQPTKTPGFEGMIAIIVLGLVLFLKRNR